MPKRSKEETKTNRESSHENLPSETIFVNCLQGVQCNRPVYNFKPFFLYGRRLWYNRDNAFQETESSTINWTENESHGPYPSPETDKDSRHRLLSKEKVVVPMRYETKSLKNKENIKRQLRSMRRLSSKQSEKKCDNKYKDLHACTDMNTDIGKYADTDEDIDADTDTDTDTDEDADADTDISGSILNYSDFQFSLERSKARREYYTPMEPIKRQLSDNNLRSKPETLFYKPVYKPVSISKRMGELRDHLPKLNLQFSTSKEDRCIDEYVEMTIPNPNESLTPKSLHKSPDLRDLLQCDKYSNVNVTKARTKHIISVSDSNCDKKNFDSNNNNWLTTSLITPEIPPPSVSQAEHTIFEYVKPPDNHLRRRSLRLENTDPLSLNDLKSFIWEDQKEPLEEQTDSLSSSRISECVEEFVGEVPFAGLFKGSSLNLANDSQLNSSVDDLSAGLRSPKLVRSIRPISDKGTFKGTKEQQNTNDFDFDPVKAWEEIQTIFECIGNEVKENDTKLKTTTTTQNDNTQTFLRKKTLSIRKPVELLLKPNNSKQQQTNSNWRHSSNILIYSSLIYKVFYLGSTVIRELHGTASTRKSIQRLKRGETPIQSDNEESSLIKDINSSTRILKETNQQTRLEVGIALSHAGVRFIDIQQEVFF
uniref:Uncharacterized protein n=1 Tax=Glossina brevipalpis TaxID=37001 RepID=A0A1A9WRS0_9MUSC